MDLEVLREVFGVIEDRRDNPKPDSYVSKLLSGGLEKILKKIGEETTELTVAATGSDKASLVHEAADLVFHIMILLAYKRVSLADVLTELRRRRVNR